MSTAKSLVVGKAGVQQILNGKEATLVRRAGLTREQRLKWGWDPSAVSAVSTTSWQGSPLPTPRDQGFLIRRPDRSIVQSM